MEVIYVTELFEVSVFFCFYTQAMKTEILIIGGGNAGISLASQLHRKNKKLQISIIEPSSKHYYQPAWTLVGAGVFKAKDTERSMESVMPKFVQWIRGKASVFKPEENLVVLENGDSVAYDFLVVAPGIQLDWDAVKGLRENLGKNGVCSNYEYGVAPYTWELLSTVKSGNILFTNPHTPVKCGGAPHKILYLAADYCRKQGLSEQVHLSYWSGGSRLFGIPKYEKTLLEVVKRGNIETHFGVKLVEIDGENKRAKFVGIGKDNLEVEYWTDYAMIHVTPPQSAPDFIKASPLANAAGWVDVDQYTLQHVKYSNVFSLGDAAGLPTAKTGAAIRKQVPVLVENLLRVLHKDGPSARYNGYSSCPLVTGYGKLVMAEFDYNNQPTETFPFDQSKERRSMYILKRYILPWLYWNQILPGRI